MRRHLHLLDCTLLHFFTLLLTLSFSVDFMSVEFLRPQDLIIVIRSVPLSFVLGSHLGQFIKHFVELQLQSVCFAFYNLVSSRS